MPLFKLSRTMAYFPAIGISSPGARVVMNLGQEPFKYNFAASKFVPLEIRTVDTNPSAGAKKRTADTKRMKLGAVSHGKDSESKDEKEEKTKAKRWSSRRNFCRCRPSGGSE